MEQLKKIACPRRPLGLFCLWVCLLAGLATHVYPPGENSVEAQQDAYGVYQGVVRDMDPGVSKGELRLRILLELPEGERILVTIAPIAQRLGQSCRVLSQSHSDWDVGRLHIGDTVEITGQRGRFERAMNPGEFDSYRYYRSLNIAYPVREGEVTLVRRGRPNLADLSWQLRRKLMEALFTIFPEDAAGILSAMLLGESGFMDPEVRRAYTECGIAHLLAVSGLHLSVLAGSLARLLKRLGVPEKLIFFVSTAFAWGYGLLIAFPSSALRALVMFTLYRLSVLEKRSYDLLTAAGVSGLIVLAVRPYSFLQSGFLFSYSAVLSLGILAPVLPGRLAKFLAVPLGSLPVYLTQSGFLSAAGLLLNPVLIPAFAVFLPLSILTIPAATVLHWCGADPHLTAIPVTAALRGLSALTEQLRGGRDLICGCPSALRILLYLGLLGALVAAGKWVPPLLRLLWCFAAVFLLTVPLPKGTSVWALDVGQGDGLVIESGRVAVLVDGGSSSRESLGTRCLLPFLRHQGIDHLDLALVSHGDTDHLSGVIELLEAGYPIDRIGISTAGFDEGGNYRRLLELASEQGIPVDSLEAGAVYECGRMSLTVLHPSPGGSYADANQGSLVVLMEEAEFTALFTGDLEKEGETAFVQALSSDGSLSEKAPITLLKAGHHGASGATSEALLSLLRPRCAIVSCGRRNRYGHPHPSVLERLAAAGTAVYDTRGGAICFQLRGGELLCLPWVLPLQ